MSEGKSSRRVYFHLLKSSPTEIRASAAELLSDPFLNPEQLEEVHPQGGMAVVNM